MSTIKPCPFCGETELLASESTSTIHKRYFIWCMNCDAQGPLHVDNGIDIYTTAHDLWDNRFISDEYALELLNDITLPEEDT